MLQLTKKLNQQFEKSAPIRSDNKREFTRFGLWELKNYYYHFGKKY